MNNLIQPKPLNGLNPSQVEHLFSQIASTVFLACQICRHECEAHGNSNTANTFSALEVMLSGVGAMADMASPQPVVGDFPAWMLGPDFEPLRGKKE